MIAHPQLTSRDYESNYYKEHADAGLDYLIHGSWHQSYAAMVTESTFQTSYANPFVLDAGCVCGSILKGFKDLQAFSQVFGIDLSAYMVALGRKEFGFTHEELVAGSIAKIPALSESVSLLHSTQVLEHIPEELIDRVVDEFVRVLRPGGRAFLCMPALREGEMKQMYMGDPTHVNIQPAHYWNDLFHKKNLVFDLEAYNHYARSRRGPNPKVERSFYQSYDRWNVWILLRR